MYRVPTAGRWRPAVGAPLERGVMRQADSPRQRLSARRRQATSLPLRLDSPRETQARTDLIGEALGRRPAVAACTGNWTGRIRFRHSPPRGSSRRRPRKAVALNCLSTDV